jgi:hypothetical protein
MHHVVILCDFKTTMIDGACSSVRHLSLGMALMSSNTFVARTAELIKPLSGARIPAMRL